MEPTISFWVDGIPVPQGSLKSVGHHRLKHANDGLLRPWREALAWHAREARPEGWVLDGAFHISLDFCFLRPKSSPKREWMTTRPDLDKLVRAVLDGITGIVVRDDSQVTHIVASKRYANTPGVLCALAHFGK